MHRYPTRSTMLLPALLITAVLVLPLHADRPLEQEGPLIQVLAGDAPPAEKAMACKKLALVGTEDAVPALAPLLTDTSLASWARIALEAIPGPAVDRALRDALPVVTGRLQIGVVNSISVRRDPQAVPALLRLLAERDLEVAEAAAVALGRIGAPQAREPLLALANQGPDPLRNAAAEGCILLAEDLLAQGEANGAAAIYDALRQAKLSPQKSAEAIRGAILARGEDGVPLLAELLHSEDRSLFNMGLHTARELPGPAVTRLLQEQIADAGPERRLHYIMVLADRGDREALPAAMQAAQEGPAPQRVTALHLMDRFDDPACLPVYLASASDPDTDVAKTARLALARWPDASVDRMIIEQLNASVAATRMAAIELIRLRGIQRAVPMLLQSLSPERAAEFKLGLKTVGDLATVEQFPELLNLLKVTPDQRSVEEALAALCIRASATTGGDVVVHQAVYGDLPDGTSRDVTEIVRTMVKEGQLAIPATNTHFGDPSGGIVKKLRVQYSVAGEQITSVIDENDTLQLTGRVTPPALVQSLLEALSQAGEAEQPALLRILQSAGGAEALAAVRSAANDPALRDTAIRLLCTWPGASALPDVIALTTSAQEATYRVLALRGEVRMIREMAAPVADKVALLEEAMAAAERSQEKRQVLAVLNELPSPEALALAAASFDLEGVQEEAAMAALAIAEKVLKQDPADVATIMQQLADQASGKIAEQAKKLREQAESARP